MATAEELQEDADEQALKSKQTVSDTTSVTRRDLAELDAHAERVANREAAQAGRLGIGFFNTKPPGAT